MVEIDSVANTEGSLICNDEKFDEDERLLLVENALRKLPELQQKVFNLRDIERLEFEDIANELDTSPEHVRVLLSRARKRIKQIIEHQLQYNRQVYE
jgi:RNA polymerase sigma-70 factor (ECF subfamily)